MALEYRRQCYGKNGGRLLIIIKGNDDATRMTYGGGLPLMWTG